MEPDLHAHFERAGVPPEQNEKVTGLLLWYGVIGIVGKEGRVGYIFDAAYDVKKMRIWREKEGGQMPLYCVHPAFRSGLDVKGGGSTGQFDFAAAWDGVAN